MLVGIQRTILDPVRILSRGIVPVSFEDHFKISNAIWSPITALAESNTGSTVRTARKEIEC